MTIENLTLFTRSLVEKNTTVLFGAGASATYFSSLNNFEMLLTNSKISEEGKALVKLAFFYTSIKNNVFLSKYINDEKWNHEYEKEMELTLNQYTRFLHNIIEYLKIRNSRISPRRVNIVTTNYDLFIESAADKILQKNPRIFFNDGTNGYGRRILNADNFNKTMLYSGVFDNYASEMPCVNLIKCHGSVNWIEHSINESVSKIQVLLKNKKFDNLSRRVVRFVKEFNKKDNHESHQKLFDSFIERINDTLADEEYLVEFINQQASNLETNEISELQKISNELYQLQIVWPTKEKFEQTLIQEHYFNMLRLVSYELEKEQSLLIVFGFSFDDEHIRAVVQRSLNNPNLIVIIFCYRDSDKDLIMSNFNFTDNSIPINVKFIIPSDFLVKSIKKEKFEGERENIDGEYIIIIDGEFVYQYAPFVSKICVKDLDGNKKDEPVIDFESLNKILEQKIDHKFKVDIKKERDQNE